MTIFKEPSIATVLRILHFVSWSSVILKYYYSGRPPVEQHYLDILFSLPAKLRYNFSPIAGAPIAGRTHTPETRDQISKSQLLVDRSGANNHMYGCTGANHPM